MTGYIYVLENESMPGLYKIGKTTRDSVTRISELSNATGIPTPFLLAFQQKFNDCHKAEFIIHKTLENRGERINNSREFFTTSLDEIVKLMLEVKKEEKIEDNFVETVISPTSLEIQRKKIMEDGISAYLGLGETIQDYEEALRLLGLANELGDTSADYWTALIYWEETFFKKKEKAVFDYLKRGIKNDNAICIGLLSILSKESRKYYNEQNSLKYRKLFFNTFKNKKLEEEHFIYFFSLISQEIRELKSISIEAKELIRNNKIDFLKYLQKRLERKEKEDLNDNEKILSYQENFLSELQGHFKIPQINESLVKGNYYHLSYMVNEDKQVTKFLQEDKWEIDQVVENYLEFHTPFASEDLLIIKSEHFSARVKEGKIFSLRKNNEKEYVEYVLQIFK